MIVFSTTISPRKLRPSVESAEDYEQLEKYTYALFERGSQMAAEKGLILVDTKYEFGKRDGKIYLIDEIHTPCFLPKSHHFAELKCSFKERELY